MALSKVIKEIYFDLLLMILGTLSNFLVWNSEILFLSKIGLMKNETHRSIRETVLKNIL
ncbi:hypothetical protein LEP1GSC059_2430 [Leptospira noguchii serovar Panama str. CZ214]|uniref:Uncharacterized protein n=1 Tax=Leptospira noguchii serovar Panama str. CZ214 TaxID=1001595 RepID=T0GZQ7_9LEPT|nr:hypothetical protein LEP1GSC059_2430 [Leptospira noguchii serovar Panama str. CZ214]